MGDVSENRALAEDWREQVRARGKRAFEDEEMLRLGFLTADDVARVNEQEISRQQYTQALEELETAHRELRRIEAELRELQDVDKAIAQIRARRIERVQSEAKVKRAQRIVDRAKRSEAERERRRTAPTFLGRGVSDHLDFTPTDSSNLAARNLPELQTFVDIARALDIEPQKLQWLCYERGAAGIDHYCRFEIPKRSGGVRLISSPKPNLRASQEWIRESVLSFIRPHSAAMAFRPGVSIVDNARVHERSAIVVRMDVKDFFPSITFPRVRGYFQSLGYNPGIASVLALLCTDARRVQVTHGGMTKIVALENRSLPQGAVTSPDLANLIAGKLDRRLHGLAKSTNWTYTRYADDLVFSTKDEQGSPHRLIRTVTTIVEDEGFEINTEKTRIMRSPNRQTVTGLLVNDEVSLTRRDLRRIRSFLHHCETEGIDQVSARIGKDARAVARGYISFVHMVSPATADRLRLLHRWI